MLSRGQSQRQCLATRDMQHIPCAQITLRSLSKYAASQGAEGGLAEECKVHNAFVHDWSDPHRPQEPHRAPGKPPPMSSTVKTVPTSAARRKAASSTTRCGTG